MLTPKFDMDGYPTDETLETIRKWPVTCIEDCEQLLKYCSKCWKYHKYTYKEDEYYIFHIGGWSGNENVIEAMEENRAFWAIAWYGSARGGHYSFKLN